MLDVSPLAITSHPSAKAHQEAGVSAFSISCAWRMMPHLQNLVLEAILRYDTLKGYHKASIGGFYKEPVGFRAALTLISDDLGCAPRRPSRNTASALIVWACVG